MAKKQSLATNRVRINRKFSTEKLNMFGIPQQYGMFCFALFAYEQLPQHGILVPLHGHVLIAVGIAANKSKAKQSIVSIATPATSRPCSIVLFSFASFIYFSLGDLPFQFYWPIAPDAKNMKQTFI